MLELLLNQTKTKKRQGDEKHCLLTFSSSEMEVVSASVNLCSSIKGNLHVAENEPSVSP